LTTVNFEKDKIPVYLLMVDLISIGFVDSDPDSGKTKVTHKKEIFGNFNG
jgi:hypothetical protein